MPPPRQTWNPRRYRVNASYVAELGKPVLDLLAAKPGERVLDIGCGDGVLTREIVRLGCEVVGIDASEDMVAAARSAGVDARLADGAELTFNEEFDAIFSNATLHWIRPPEAVVAGAWRALRPGGRFVGEFGGSGNVACIIDAIDAAFDRRGVREARPWFFPTAADYSRMLEEAGFDVRSCELFARPTPLPGDVRGWLETFAGHYLSAVADGDRESLIAEVVDRLRPSLEHEDGTWFADYVRLRFDAEKPTGETQRPGAASDA